MTAEQQFTCVSVGLYDDTMECVKCGFRYMDSADATLAENAKRAEHDCKEKTSQ